MSIQTTSPRVTIITATYNYSSVLRYAIASVLAQTFQAFEYLIIGDACTDDTAEVVASFNDPRLHFHNLATNSGSQSAPNNKGLELARGEYIAYLGHDDLWAPNHLETLVRALDDTGAEWAHPLAVMIGPPQSDVRVLIGLVEPGTDPARATYLTSGVMHRRARVDTIGKWKDYRTLEITPDREFHQRCRNGVKIAYLENLSVFKFPSAWRKNVYRDKPSHEQAAYLERMRQEKDFIQNELLAVIKASEFGTYDKWAARIELPLALTPTAPLGTLVESWRRYRGLTPNALTPRPWWEILRIRAWRALADVTRPVRQALRRATK